MIPVKRLLDWLANSIQKSNLLRRLSNLGLNSKLMVIIVLISLIGVVTSSVLVLTLQRQQLENSALIATTQQSDAINVSLEHAMYDNDQAMVTLIIQNMVAQQSVDQIRILDSDGIVRASSSPSEVGQQLDYSQPTCQFCHTNGSRPNNRTAIVHVEANREVLVNVNLVYNKTQCQSCHDPRVTMLGMTMIEVPLTNLNNQLTEGFWRIAISGLVILGLLIVLMTLALRRLVIKPVEQLTRGMTEIHDGNLDYQLPQAYAQDELGELAETFDALRAQLKASRAENAELQKRTHSLGILEERDRLAREMHDNLAQTLGYINLKASVADSQLVSNQAAEARLSLVELKQAAREAYIDVRESIFNLRAPNCSGDGLVPMLANTISQYRAQYGMNVNLSIEDERLTQFPVEVQVQVHRIIQEALTNVRKHSNASQARIRIERIDHSVRIQVEDNGKGFDPATLTRNGSSHFGLQIMRERAESVGGELRIDSKIGSGTRIQLYVPIYPLIEDPHEDTSYLAR